MSDVPTYQPPPSIFDKLYPERHNELPVTQMHHRAIRATPKKPSRYGVDIPQGPNDRRRKRD